MNRRNWIKLIVTAIVLLIIAILLYVSRYHAYTWGRGNLMPPERSCCASHIKRIIQTSVNPRKGPPDYYEVGRRMRLC